MSQNRTRKRSRRLTPGQKQTRFKVMIGSIVFYLFFFAYLAVLLHAAIYGYSLLIDWLNRYEASQPDKICEKVFQDLFGDPDWEALYEMAGEEDTIYEGAEEYAIYMDNLVGDTELTYVETSAGLSGDKKYIVKADSTKVAEFTLKDLSHVEADIPEWTLGEVSVFYTRQEDLFVFTVPGHTVHINGVPLDTEQYVVGTTSTVVEDYLPSDLDGYRDMTLYFEGLLLQPEVTILDENGAAMEVVYDAETNTYSEVIVSQEISQELFDVVVAANKAYGKYMITAINKTAMKSYFSTTGSAYANLPNQWELWMQSYSAYNFTEATVRDYYQYSEDFFSARVEMILQVTRKDGSVKDYDMSTTFFVRKNSEGKWLVESMTNVDVQARTSMVKLVYMNGGTVVHTEWVEVNAESIQLPDFNIPEGRTFLGWFTKSVEGNKTTYSLVFAGSEDGIVYLPEGNTLTYMVLYAQFQ